MQSGLACVLAGACFIQGTMSIYYNEQNHDVHWSSREQGDIETLVGSWKVRIRGLTLSYIFEELCALPQFRWRIKEKALELVDEARIKRHEGHDNLKDHRENTSLQRLYENESIEQLKSSLDDTRQ
jgi:hypothetical protein